MAAGFTPGHDWSGHAVMDVVDDAWQSWADVYEESSMASWAQRLSRVIVGILVASEGSRSLLRSTAGEAQEECRGHAVAQAERRQ